MRDYISIGPVPGDEECAQLGRENYNGRARKECDAFTNQLRRHFGKEPDGAQIGTKRFPHDFGTYLEVVVWYEPTNNIAADFAFKVEANAPLTWDAEARKELGLTASEQ